jgi:hypothetical protein
MCLRRESLYGIERGVSDIGDQSYPDYLDLRDRNRSFDGLAAYIHRAGGAGHGQRNPSSAWCYEVSGNYFDALGIQPYLGRFFHGADEHGPTALRISCSPTRIGTAIFRTIAAWWAAWSGEQASFHHPRRSAAGVPRNLLFFSPDFWVPMVNQEQVEGLNT